MSVSFITASVDSEDEPLQPAITINKTAIKNCTPFKPGSFTTGSFENLSRSGKAYSHLACRLNKLLPFLMVLV